MSNPSAVFLDRDGVIIEDSHFISKPDQVRLLKGAAEAIKKLNDAGIPVVVATNQSGIARGYFSELEYGAVKNRLDELLAAAGARIDATYYCPHHPDITGECDCRKPSPGMFLLAAKENNIDLSQAVFVGDRYRDIAAAQNFGASAFLVTSSHTSPTDQENAARFARDVSSLSEVVDLLSIG